MAVGGGGRRCMTSHDSRAWRPSRPRQGRKVGSSAQAGGEVQPTTCLCHHSGGGQGRGLWHSLCNSYVFFCTSLIWLIHPDLISDHIEKHLNSCYTFETACIAVQCKRGRNDKNIFVSQIICQLVRLSWLNSHIVPNPLLMCSMCVCLTWIIWNSFPTKPEMAVREKFAT